MTDVHRSLYCSVSVWTCPLFLKLAITRRPAPHSLLQSTGRKINLRRARPSSSTKVQSDSAGARLLPQPTPFHTCVLCVCPGERGWDFQVVFNTQEEWCWLGVGHLFVRGGGGESGGGTDP